MTNIQHVQPAVLPAQPVGSTPPAPPADAPLLPAPAAAPTDPLSTLYLIEAKDRDGTASTGASKIQGLEVERGKALQKELKAIKEADEARNRHDFFSDVGNACGKLAKVGSVVGSVAAAAATCGAATPLAAVAIAGAVVSTAGFVDGEAHVLEKLGVDAKTAGLIDVGLSVGGSVATLGASSLAGGAAATEATQVASRGSAVVTGLATLGKGASVIAEGHYQADLDRATADQVMEQSHSDQLHRAIQHVLDDVKDADEKSKQYLGTIAQTRSIQLQTAETASSVALKG